MALPAMILASEGDISYIILLVMQIFKTFDWMSFLNAYFYVFRLLKRLTLIFA